MMMRVTDKEIEAVLRLDGPARLERFVKVVADAEEAWGLWDDGWALLEDDAGIPVFPLWPAKEYADLCRENDWANYEARRIPLGDLLDELLPKLRGQGALAGVFPVPAGRGITPDLDALEAALREELEQYE